MRGIARKVRLWTWVASGLLVAGAASACAGSPEAPAATAPVASPVSVPVSVPATATTGTSRTPPSAAPRQFTVVATGDVLLHPPLWDQARADARADGGGSMDFGPMLAGLKPYTGAADLAICHLETPLAATSGPFSGYPDFSGPPQIATALRGIGYDACSTDSNHTLDQGSAGIERTLDTLDAAGIAHAGSARTQAESQRITLLEAGGTKIALLSYAYGFNGHSYPAGQTWRANQIDPDQIVDDAQRARKLGAQVVIAALHWGTEYQSKPSRQQLTVAPQLARSGVIDLIISHHAHVVEPIARIGRVWVVYGLGNLLAFHSTPGAANQEGLLAQFTFTRTSATRWTVTRAGYLPLLVTRTAPIRVVSVPALLSTQDYGPATRARLMQALDRTTTVVTSMGGTRQGLIRLR